MSAVRSFSLPDLGEGLADAEIVAWRVAPGDTVALNQILAEVETEKAVVELPSPFAGTVVELLAQPGETVAVGVPIVTIETVVPEGDAPATEPAADSEPGRVPTLVGYGPTESPPIRRRTRRTRSAGTRHGRGATIDPSVPTSPAPATPGIPGAAAVTGPARPDGRIGRPLAAPPVRFMARQEGVDLADVVGHGPAGIVTRDDLAAYLGGRAATTEAATADAGADSAEPVDTTAPPARSASTRTALHGIQRRMAEAMVRSVAEAPQACVFLSVDVSETAALVERLRTSRHFGGTRVTLLGIVAKAVLRALEEHPELNASWDADHREMVFAPHVNLGIAVAAPSGLLVPNIPEADRRSLKDLAQALGDLVERAREGRCAPSEFRGGTFTITNVGVFGVDGGVAILNPGEAGILAVGAVRRTPWEHEGNVALRDVVNLSLTFDHRLVDGRQASGFLTAVGHVLADPLELLAFA